MADQRIFIGMPTTGGVNSQHTTISLFETAACLGKAGIESIIRCSNNTAVPEARDLLAKQFLDSDATHLLFVDSDMAFPPDLCGKLLSHKVDIVGTIYARRKFRADEMKRWIENGKSFDAAFAAAYSFIVKNPSLPEGKTSLMLCDGLGMGFVLIARPVFELMAGLVKLRKYTSFGFALTGFFDRKLVDEELLSEDVSFFHRWTTELGKPLYADPTAKVLHIGEFPYGMEFLRAQILMQRG